MRRWPSTFCVAIAGESVDLSEFIAAYPGCEEELRQVRREGTTHQSGDGRRFADYAPSQDLAGRTLGDFRLLRIIGRGGMGVVWEAEQLSLRRKVAVKLLPGALCSDPRHRTRFQNEARILAQLEHPNIVNVIAVGEEADTYYFAMQYIDGITADDLIRCGATRNRLTTPRRHAARFRGDTERLAQAGERACLRNPLPQWIAARANRRERYRQCARIASEIADGLVHAHACGVLHRDVKPSNILLDTMAQRDLPISAWRGCTAMPRSTATGTILGTLRYASPEQLRRHAGRSSMNAATSIRSAQRCGNWSRASGCSRRKIATR